MVASVDSQAGGLFSAQQGAASESRGGPGDILVGPAQRCLETVTQPFIAPPAARQGEHHRNRDCARWFWDGT